MHSERVLVVVPGGCRVVEVGGGTNRALAGIRPRKSGGLIPVQMVHSVRVFGVGPGQFAGEDLRLLPQPLVLIARLCGTFNLASSAPTQLATSGITGTSMPELSSQGQILLRATTSCRDFEPTGTGHPGHAPCANFLRKMTKM